jgi:predicted enzyme related to lactoylglutathione lyase
VTDVGGERPNWLPYVAVDGADARLARARRLGGTICTGPEDIPDVGRFGVRRIPPVPRLRS